MTTMQYGLVHVPIRVRWYGWDSDTYTLKSLGWSVFADERMASHSYAHNVTLGIKSPDGNLLLSGTISIPMHDLSHGGHSLIDTLRNVGVEMKGYHPSDRCMVHETSRSTWNSMDEMMPTSDGLASICHGPEVRYIKDLKLFKYTESPKEIYIPSGSVDECLNRILQLQFPEQQIIKKGEGVVRPVVQAKIYSLAA